MDADLCSTCIIHWINCLQNFNLTISMYHKWFTVYFSCQRHGTFSVQWLDLWLALSLACRSSFFYPGAWGQLKSLNFGNGLARVKARVEVSSLTYSGKSYKTKLWLTPKSAMLLHSRTYPARDFPPKNCYVFPVLQWPLPAELCQPAFGGKDGSIALICTFWGEWGALV